MTKDIDVIIFITKNIFIFISVKKKELYSVILPSVGSIETEEIAYTFRKFNWYGVKNNRKKEDLNRPSNFVIIQLMQIWIR